jgi:hypothetical protein
MSCWGGIRDEAWGKAGFFGFFLFMYDIQHCFICRPSTVSEDAGIEPRTVATTALAVRRFNHSVRSHPQRKRGKELQYFVAIKNFKTGWCHDREMFSSFYKKNVDTCQKLKAAISSIKENNHNGTGKLFVGGKVWKRHGDRQLNIFKNKKVIAIFILVFNPKVEKVMTSQLHNQRSQSLQILEFVGHLETG